MTNITKAAQDALEALEEIALAGMSGSGQESEEGMRDWHARQAWKFIGIAARALDALRAALQDKAGEVAVTVAIDNLWNERRDGMTGAIFPLVQIGTRLFSAQPAPVVPERLPSGMATSTDNGKWRVLLEFDVEADAKALHAYMIANKVPSKSMATSAPVVPDGHPLMVFAKECELGAYMEHEVPLAARKAIAASQQKGGQHV